MTRQVGEELAQAVALGIARFVAEIAGRHLVGLIAYDQVPVTVARLQLLLHLLVARELVEAGDDEVGFEEPVAAAGGFELVIGEDLEGQLEAPVELILPLFGQRARTDDQAALEVAAGDQLLDQQAAMIVLPAPGSSASRKRSGERGSIAS